MTEKNPLVSICLIAYRQERLVRAAIDGLLAQTYQPLEIVLSDDYSPDGTYAVMEDVARTYRGPHRLILRQNKENLGLTGHVNAVVAASHGELIFLAAGDDVSLPERVCRTVERWQAEGCPRGSLCTDCRLIDADGVPLAQQPRPLPPSPHDLVKWVKNPFPLVIGASHAFHRDLYRVFGPLLPDRGSEDMPLAMRALALDGVFHIREPLVLYRRHRDNAANYIEDRPTLRKALLEEHIRHKRRAGFMEQVLIDFKHEAFENKWGKRALKRAARAVHREYRRETILSEWQASLDSPVGKTALNQAWQWPPLWGMTGRLILRRLFPWLHTIGFRFAEWRWQRDYQRRQTR